MGLLTRAQYKYIEQKLHGYRYMKQRADDWMQDSGGACSPEPVPGRGRISDPTAARAIRLASPPPDIQRMLEWVRVIERARLALRGSGAEGLFVVWYGRPRQSTIRAAMALHADKRTFYRWKDRVVEQTAIYAASAGIFDALTR